MSTGFKSQRLLPAQEGSTIEHDGSFQNDSERATYAISLPKNEDPVVSGKQYALLRGEVSTPRSRQTSINSKMLEKWPGGVKQLELFMVGTSLCYFAVTAYTCRS